MLIQCAAFETGGMNTKGLIKFGRGNSQKQRLVEILSRSKKHRIWLSFMIHYSWLTNVF
nr:hypothetical protein Iba_chr07cCG5480 [Ipomoea batatas]